MGAANVCAALPRNNAAGVKRQVSVERICADRIRHRLVLWVRQGAFNICVLWSSDNACVRRLSCNNYDAVAGILLHDPLALRGRAVVRAIYNASTCYPFHSLP